MEDTKQVQEAIEKLKLELPKEVVDFEYEIGLDSTGDPALWIWLILEQSEDAWSRENRAELRERIDKTLRDVGVARWPYIRFRGVEELALPLPGNRPHA